MTNYMRISLLGLALVAALALTACQAKEAAQQKQQQQASLVSKILPQTRSRTARSLSDMFEKVKGKIFGSKKQAAQASAIAPAANGVSPNQLASSASAPSAQRQPWEQQQYNPYYPLMASSSYQWPASVSGNQQPQQQQFTSNQVNSFGGQQSMYPSSLGLQGFDSSAQVGNVQSVSQPSVKSSAAPSSGGLFSSASHLFAQYMSPNSALGQQSSAQPAANQQPQLQQQQQPNSALTPQQQSQYNEFASVLDSLVAQTGPSSPIRQPNQPQQQYQSVPDMSLAGQQQQPQQQPQQFGGSQAAGQQPNSMIMGDQDMSASSNIGSYLLNGASNGAMPQQASQKSSGSGSQMIGLAEQLAPGSQFNKLISFPFSLSNNDDPSKEGRFKLHIPFLNQHVKRSDQQQAAAKSAAAAVQAQSQQQQQQQYLAQQQQQQYFNQQQQQQQQYLAPQQQQQLALPSQIVPVVASPTSQMANPSGPASQSVAHSGSSVSSLVQSQAVAQADSPSHLASLQQSGSSVQAAQAPVSSSISSSVSISSSNPSVSSSIVQSSGNRSAWSVSDSHSSQPIQASQSSASIPSSSSKMISLQNSA